MAKKKHRTSPTQRSLKHLRNQGFHAQVVEKVVPYKFIKIDLFGWIDLVAVKPGEPITGVQTTTGPHVAHRIGKARGNVALEAWLQAGGRLAVHSWRKRGPRGKRKVWTVLEREVTLEDISGTEPVETDPKRQDRRRREVQGKDRDRIGTPGNGADGFELEKVVGVDPRSAE